jgi:hypothetical protein
MKIGSRKTGPGLTAIDLGQTELFHRTQAAVRGEVNFRLKRRNLCAFSWLLSYSRSFESMMTVTGP